MLLTPLLARANFHVWRINEIYSNEDGTVQFIEFTCTASGQHVLLNHQVRCIGPQATNTFTFPASLTTSISTLNATMILATSAFTNMPGAVPADYVIANNFIPLNGGSVNFGLNTHILTYTNLATDGVISYLRVTNGGVTNLSWVQTNSPRNFAGQQGSIVPVRVPTLAQANDALIISYPTAANKSYVIEHRDSLAVTNWQPLSTNAGSGVLQNSTNAFSNLLQRIFRVRAE